MRLAADAAVVGAGVIGSAIALELARGGRTVVVLDKAAGPGDGSTSASSAIVRFNYSTYAGVALAWESRACWEAWADHLGHRDEAGLATFRRTGALHLDVPVVPRGPVLALLGRAGVPYEELDAEQLVVRFPQLDNGSHWPNKRVTDEEFWAESTRTLGGFLTPDAGFVDDPRLAAHNLAAAARDLGVTFRFRAAVTGVRRHASGTWSLGLADGATVEAPVVVNAAGPWSSGLNRLAGVGAEFTIGVRPLRQEVHQAPAPEGWSVDDAHPGPTVTDVDLGMYVRASAGGHLLVGGTEPACDGFEWVDDPDASDPGVTVERHEAQLFRAARRLPDLRIPNRPSGIAGVYDVAEDWTPIYDRTDAPGFYVAMGTSGNQFKNAPVVGRMMAALIDGVEAGHDHDAHPTTVAAEHTGNTIDLGTFSRTRARNADSSGTVLG